jgi:hypothetical protein
MTYEEAKAEAQRAADLLGFDYGIEKGLIGGHRVFMLPQKRNRRGFELRCEVVSAIELSKCRPGHGPCAQ